MGAIPRHFVRRELHGFLESARDCRTSQRGVLRRLLHLNGDSRFAIAHGLNENLTPAEFRQRLPVTDYDFFSEYVEQVKAGDHRALLGSGNPLLMFSLSSGTTNQSKFIPITKQFLSDYRRGWQIWGIRTLDEHPQLNALNILQLSSDDDRFRTAGGTPCGNISGLAASMQKRIVRTMYSVPNSVARIENSAAKQYTVLRLALADRNVGMIVTANASTLIQLARLAVTSWDDLLRDIADGTLSTRYDVSQEVRAQLRRRIGRKNKTRARELEALSNRWGECRPKDYWPNLQVVGVWTGGSAGAYLPSLRRSFGDVAVRDHGLSASEGRMTIPLCGDTAQGVLEVDTHYFEFIPEEEYGRQSPMVLAAHELQPQRNYYILLTTASGLYRYNICDVVRCTGFFETTPVLEFLHKGEHISNVTGEKVSESQVVTAVRRCVEQMQIDLRHYTVAPVWAEPPHYQLLVERRDFPSEEMARGFVRRVDLLLQNLNCEYREKRNSGRLDNMIPVFLPQGTWAEFTRHQQQGIGGSVEQYKHPCLVPDLNFAARVIGATTDDAA